jgi:hypothetical protein
VLEHGITIGLKEVRMISQTRFGSAYMLGADTLGASYTVAASPQYGVIARVDDIPIWTAIALGAASIVGAIYVLSQ